MKLSIWQQFSSNHSASFTVVGVFEDAEKAEEAAKTIRDVVGKIHEHYHQRFPDSMDFFEWAEDIDIRSLSPYEQALRKEYKIAPRAWYMATDWAYENTPVRVFQNLVFVSSNGDSWSPFAPVDSLIKKAGGKFYGSQEGYGYSSFMLLCKAKDKESAKRIEETLRLIEHKYDFEYRYIQIPDGLRFSAEIEVKEARISIQNIPIYATSRGDSDDTVTILDALISYLEGQGCTNFQYKFKETRQ